jgi:hypothetical protein
MHLISCDLTLPSPRVAVKGQTPTAEVLLLADETSYLGIGSLQDGEGGACWVLSTGDTLPLHAVHYWSFLTSVQLFTGSTESMERFDEEGYPTPYALETLKNWPWGDPVGWLHLAQELWHWGDRAFSLTQDGQDWNASAATGGWSGNESVIAAMRENFMLWSTLWMSSARGGRYVFLVERKAEGKAA